MVVVICHYDLLFSPLYFNDDFAIVVMIHSPVVLAIILHTKDLFWV